MTGENSIKSYEIIPAVVKPGDSSIAFIINELKVTLYIRSHSFLENDKIHK
jgi:hypothetical protein